MGNEIAKKKENLPATTAEMDALMEQDASNSKAMDDIKMADIALPFLYLLQSGSKQCGGANPVEGAREGVFYNTVTNQVFKGANLIPCAFKKSFVEWAPRESGGGYRGEHSEEAILDTCKKNEKGQFVLPSGNIIQTTCYFYCLHVKENGSAEPIVVGLSSTQIKKAKRWNNQITTLRVKNGEGKLYRPAMFSHAYKVSSVPESNEKGAWSGWVIEAPVKVVDGNTYMMARQFSEDVIAGKVKTQTPMPDEEAGDGGAAKATADASKGVM